MPERSAASGTDPIPDTGEAGQLAEGPGPAVGELSAAVAAQSIAEPLDFAKAIRDYEAKLLRYATTLLGGPDATGGSGQDLQPTDLVQEAFLRLHGYCREHGSSAIAHPGSWLYRVVHNLAMDAIRRRVRQRGAQAKIEDSARLRAAAADEADAAALGQLEQHELVALAMRLLGDLPEQQQQVISLKLLEGLSLRQIAVVLGTTPGSVNYHFNQGLSRLAQQLRQKGVV
ncbi:MAG: RNA polymerase sigma factor [Phycisphaeraceae bacterium]|nr:RNA polymerase sigma factor [Phycisphaeraceae bacterium]